MSFQKKQQVDEHEDGATQPQRRQPCPNGASCPEFANRQCSNYHPAWHTPCRDGINCTNRACHFGHPRTAAPARNQSETTRPPHRPRQEGAVAAANAVHASRPRHEGAAAAEVAEAEPASQKKQQPRHERPARAEASAPKQKPATSTVPPPPTDLMAPQPGFKLVLELIGRNWHVRYEKM